MRHLLASLLAMFLGHRFCASRNGGTVIGGTVKLSTLRQLQKKMQQLKVLMNFIYIYIALIAGATVHSFSFFGPGTGPIWLDNVQCSGIEARLVNCSSSQIGVHNCHHSEDAGVTCQSKAV